MWQDMKRITNIRSIIVIGSRRIHCRSDMTLYARLSIAQGTMTFNVNTYEYIRDNFAAVAADSEALLIALATYLLPHHDALTFDDLLMTHPV